MSIESQWDVQTAIYTALTTHTGLTNLLADAGNSVFDHVPKQTKFPYIVIGDHRAKPFETQQNAGMDIEITLHSWSQYQGQKEIKEITSEIYTVLHDTDFLIPNHILVMNRLLSTETKLEKDGVTYHSIQIFRILTEPTE